MNCALISAVSTAQTIFGCHEKICVNFGEVIMWCAVILKMQCGFSFMEEKKKCVSSYFSVANILFRILYLKLQILDQLVWEITCCENAITCANVFERVLTVKLVYISYKIAQWSDATRSAVKKEKKKGGLLNATLRWCAFWETHGFLKPGRDFCTFNDIESIYTASESVHLFPTTSIATACCECLFSRTTLSLFVSHDCCCCYKETKCALLWTICFCQLWQVVEICSWITNLIGPMLCSKMSCSLPWCY